MHIAYATAPGSAHVNPGQPGKTNNQDAVLHRTTARGSITVACDGCGSQPHSGTGADIGSYLIAQVLEKHLATAAVLELDWERVTKDVTKALRAAAGLFVLNDSLSAFEQTVVERFLFTAMVCIVDGDTAIVAAFGDGVVVADDEVTILTPLVLNSPPYLGYLLLTQTAYHTDELKPHLGFQIVKTVALSSLEKGLIVGTDGLKDLVDEDLHHPALVQPKSLQRWLNAQTMERISGGAFIAGKCPDDVTLVIIRTDAAQQRLFESKREVAELKQRVTRLDASVVELTEQWERTRIAREAAEARVGTLEQELETLTTRAKEADVLSGAMSDLEREIGALRGRIKRAHSPLMETLDRFFGRLRRSGSGNGQTSTSIPVRVGSHAGRAFPEDPIYRGYQHQGRRR
jgi:serine/threonine protein phosphatase PrpC